LTLQAKMLRAVEYGEVQRVGSLEARKADVFAVAATNRDLRASAAQGTFRSDLYFRLSTIELHIPPLRDRREDIPYLTASFIREFANKMNRPIKGITAQAERMLQQAAWTGNVRELRNVIERACILTDYRIITEREMTTAMAMSDRDDQDARALDPVDDAKRKSPQQVPTRSVVVRWPRVGQHADGRLRLGEFRLEPGRCSGTASGVPLSCRRGFDYGFFEILKVEGHVGLPRECADGLLTTAPCSPHRRRRDRAAPESRRTTPLLPRRRLRARGSESIRQRAPRAPRLRVSAPPRKAASNP